MTTLPEVPTEELLNFQDFPTNTEQIQPNSIPPTSPQKNDDLSTKQDFNSNSDSNTKSFWTLEYYQQFFDVDTDEVIHRLKASVNPKQALGETLEQKPDLYGPFWITTTLIFAIAVSGNMANYLQEANVHYHWKYDFHLVSYAATAIISYVCLTPISIWFLLKWTTTPNLDTDDTIVPSILKLMCLYGYSLFIFIPTSILWTIQIVWFQWVLVILAAILSGSVLVLALYPSLRSSRYKLIFALSILFCHFLLALSFMLYFFHVPDHSPVVKPTVKPTNNVTHV